MGAGSAIIESRNRATLPSVSAKSPAKTSESFDFLAKVVRFGTLYGVDVPAEISRTIGVRGYVAIVGTVSGKVPFRASLVPRGGGQHRILLNGRVREAAGAVLGRALRVAFRVDIDPPEWPTPEDVADALREEGVLETFTSLTRGKRAHILQWVEAAVHESTRAKRVAKVVEVTLAEHEKRLDRAAARRNPAPPKRGRGAR